MQEILLTPENLPGFAHLIPEPLQQAFLDGSIAGVGAVDLMWRERMAAAVLLCRQHNGWLEIVWLAVDPQRRGMDLAGDLLDRRVDNARIRRMAAGVFADLPQDDMRQKLEALFERHGFAMREVELPVYSVALGRLEQVELLRRPVSEHTVVPLQAVDAALRHAIEEVLQRNTRPIPVVLPVDWKQYDPALSAVALQGGQPVALLLSSRGTDSVTVDLLWASVPMAAAQLLAFSAQRAKGMLPPDTQVILPTVTEVTRQMVNRLLPDAQPLHMTQARLCFDAHTEDGTEVQ